MSDHGTLKDLLEDSRLLIKDWAETELKIQKLKLVRSGSKIAGNLAWVILLGFLFSLLIIFVGVTAGFWFSELTGSYVKGFGIVAGLILLKIILLVLLRKKLFIDPVVRKMIHAIMDEPHNP